MFLDNLDPNTIKELEHLVVPALQRGEDENYITSLFMELYSVAELETGIKNCEKCNLKEKRTQVVIGEGSKNADMMFIGESPGKDEDVDGRPFVGKAGKMLDKIIEAAEWNREDIYITNTIKCRPPDNRDPKQEEIAKCTYWLEKEIERVGPKLILCWGRIASEKLIHPDFKVTKECGKVYENKDGIKLIGLYHPANIIRKSAEDQKKLKHEVWGGIKNAKEILGEIQLRT